MLTPTGAVYGFFNMILPILAAAKPSDSFVCICDASRITFRQDIYSNYKANRSETPADLISQGALIRAGMAAVGIMHTGRRGRRCYRNTGAGKLYRA